MTSIDFLPLFDGRSACVIGEGPLAVTIQGAFAGRGARLVSEAVAEADVWPDITSIIIDNMPLYERTMSNLGRMFALARRFGDRRLAQRTVVIILRHDPAKATATVALCQMARSFACELGRVGGRVNLILHGDFASLTTSRPGAYSSRPTSPVMSPELSCRLVSSRRNREFGMTRIIDNLRARTLAVEGEDEASCAAT